MKLCEQANGGKVAWQDHKPDGRWSYGKLNASSVNPKDTILMEFKSTTFSEVPLRRHALVAYRDKCFRLLAQDHGIYQEEHLWSPGSVVHNNRCDEDQFVTMQRLYA